VSGSPEELLRSALEKIVFFECRLSSLESELEGARSAAARAREEAQSARRREGELEALFAQARGEHAVAVAHNAELVERVRILETERERFLTGMVERARVAGAPSAAGDDPGDESDLAGFIAELRLEIEQLRAWKRAAEAQGVRVVGEDAMALTPPLSFATATRLPVSNASPSVRPERSEAESKGPTATANPHPTATSTANPDPSPNPSVRPERSAAESKGGVPPLPPPPTPAERARTLFAAAVEKARGEQHTAAATDFDAARALDPSLGWAAFDAGCEHEAAGDVDRAVAAYAAVPAGHPAAEPARTNAQRLKVRAGRAKDAEAELRARADAEPTRADRRAALAALLLAAGRADDAAVEARRALALDERSVAAMAALGGAYHARGKEELARMVLENARQLDPRDATVQHRLGFVLAALGDRPAALEAWRAAAALAPGDAAVLVSHGAALVEAEDHAAAVAPLEAAVRVSPRSAEAWLALGSAYRGLSRFDDAERALSRALALAPALADAEYDLALLYLDGEKPGLAASERLQKAVALLDAYAARPGADPEAARWRKEAQAQLDREQKRLAREARQKGAK
jgi:tetratricopeptide (TPR) repeat protein